MRAPARIATSCCLSVVIAGCSSDTIVLPPGTVPPTVTSQVATVVVTPETAFITVGDTLRLGAATRDALGRPLDGRFVSWSTESAATATVSASGLVTGTGAGSIRITATSEGRTGSATITVSR